MIVQKGQKISRMNQMQSGDGIFSDIWNKGKQIYSKIKQFQPATKSLNLLAQNPILNAGFNMIPNSGLLKQGLEWGQKQGFGKTKRKYKKGKGKKSKK